MLPFTLKFQLHSTPETSINFQELSSGEQMIVTLMLWAFDEQTGERRSLLILDEPDAHLHPSMAKMFKEIIYDILVKKLGIQVILSTHSPTTVCWFPDASIFSMCKDKGPTPLPKRDAMGHLTSGLVFVQEAFNLVLTEDKDDQNFYQTIYDELCAAGHLARTPGIIFRSVRAPGDAGGGKTNVIRACDQWTKYLQATEIGSLIAGVVDRDSDENLNLPNNCFVIPRYCHENFLADPIIIFTVLADCKDPNVSDLCTEVSYVSGEELKIKTNIIQNPQLIVDRILERLGKIGLEIDVSKDPKGIRPCTYMNGISVDLPASYWDISGKDILLPAYRAAFPDSQSKFNHKILRTQMTKTMHIPTELVDVLQKLSGTHMVRE